MYTLWPVPEVALHKNKNGVEVLGQADFSTQVLWLWACSGPERCHFVLQGLPPGMILVESELDVGLTLKIGYFQEG